MGNVKWDPEIFKKNIVVISPSAYTDYRDCNRLLWWNKFRKMPGRPRGKQFTYGNVLHGAWERWLAADDQGRVPMATDPIDLAFGRYQEGPLKGQKMGDLVDIFPMGWDIDDKKRVSPAENAQIRRRTKEAIEAGVLRRLPDRQLEVPYDIQIIPNAAMIGVIDQFSPPAPNRLGIIEDHKSTKAKKWALTPTKLKKDAKMLCYAAWFFDRYPKEDEVILRLNYASKDQKAKEPVWAVEATVSRADLKAFWDETCAEAQDVIDLRMARFRDEDWEKVEEPKTKDVCKRYGKGCDYQAICSKQITPAAAREAARLRDEITKAKTEGKPKMGLKNKKKKATGFGSKKDEAPITSVAIVEEEAPAIPAPPWAVASCKACKGTGFNGEGHPCRACDVVSGRTGGRTSSEFKIWQGEDGMVRWAEAEGAPIEGPEVAEVKKPSKPKKGQKKASKKKTSSKPKKEPEAKEDTVPATEDPIPEVTVVNVVNASNPEEVAEVEQALGIAPEPVERHSGIITGEVTAPGFTLYLGCMPLDGAVIDLSHVFGREAQEYAEAVGKASYFEANSFERRDALATQAATIAGNLIGHNVVLMDRNPSPDLKSFLDALRPYAARTVVAV